MTTRKFWTQLHWLLGITAGTILLLIGLTGATLAFRQEITELINPGVLRIAAPSYRPATPDVLLQGFAAAEPERRVATLTLYAEPGRTPKAILEPAPGERRGDVIYLNPVTGAPLPDVTGAEVFEVAESLHRWLLLPRELGRVVTGVLAIGLLVLALSGLYLRWPRDWKSVADWWRIDRKTRGRALLRRLHLVVGTACLVAYVPVTLTGIFWAFDGVRDPVSAWLGEPRPPRAPARPMAGKNDGAKAEKTAERSAEKKADRHVPIDAAWQAFERAAVPGGWSEVIVRVPTGAKAPILFTWLDTSPAHERARNRTTIKADSGEVVKDERYGAKAVGGQVLAAIYPLHMGTLFGLPGRIAMCIAALMLPAFTITGWWLYLGRKRLEREAAEKRLRKASSAGLAQSAGGAQA
ncbi:PepSY-associated TM helix domain-containing protein [Roseateles chitinivorans]|uniref:PepSY-associated TM helix domain-containing protein n=1 Tax=Roseateles chitinivorans TaxID=2917965 RepID=UPI003D67B3C4